MRKVTMRKVTSIIVHTSSRKKKIKKPQEKGVRKTMNKLFQIRKDRKKILNNHCGIIEIITTR